MGWEKKLDRARSLHRPSLKDWERDGLYERFPSYVESLSPRESFALCQKSPAPSLPVILDAKYIKAEDFFRRYEATRTPCVIRNIPHGFDDATARAQWDAIHKWSLAALEENHDLRNRLFKCGEDDDGKSVKVKLKHFLKYLHNNRDDSPLYIFDSSFEDDPVSEKLLKEYRVPSYFSDDLFRFISESRRPPYRWFLVGPQRSGTTIHIDPLATNAWNTLLHGKKRWVLFPPHIPKHIVKGRGLIRKDEDDEAVHYFMYILPRIKRQAAARKNHAEYRDFACYEFTQYAGETCFVPHGWWHAVLNLTHTVGVTQNYCSPRNFEHSWYKTRKDRPRMAWKLLCRLEQEPQFGHLAELARKVNQRDNFRMKYDPDEVARRQQRDDERRRKQQKL